MQVRVKGASCTVPDGVRREAIEKLSRVQKLFDRFIDMEIVFTKDGNPRVRDGHGCEVVLHAKGKYLRAEGRGADWPSAIDAAEAKLARQVRKYKTQVVSKGRRTTAESIHELEERVAAGVTT